MATKKFTYRDIMRSKVAHLNRHLHAQKKKEKGSGIVVPKIKVRSKGLDFIQLNLTYWANNKSLQLVEEHQFAADRKWRFDFALPSVKIAVEFEGGIFMEDSGHNTAKGSTRDMDKYNRAIAEGWKVLRFGAQNYKNLVTELNNAYGKS